MRTELTYEDKQYLNDAKSTLMIGRYVNHSARVIDHTSNNIIFSIEPLCDEPHIIQSINYDYHLFPEQSIYTGVDRAAHSQNAFPEYYDFQSFDVDSKIEIINSYYQDCLVIFHPTIRSSSKTNAYFRNLEIIDVISIHHQTIPNHYYVIPKVNMDQKIFEMKLKNNEYFELEHYPSDLYNSLKFVICGHDLYECNFIFHENDEEITAWKAKSPTYKKYDLRNHTDLHIIASKKDPFILFIDEQLIYELEVSNLPKLEDEQHKEVSSIDFEEDTTSITEEQALDSFITNVKKAKLCYRPLDLINFHVCMKSAPLVIVAGMSGTGKTRITFEYARLLDMSETNNNLLFFPISPSFSEPSDITGYYNAMNNHYVPAEGGLVDFLIHAQNNLNKMHMVIFDEMNLAQIEYYFSQFLSILERKDNKKTLTLYNDYLHPENKDQYPSSIKINENVLFVGTVNLDETTNNLSDRLLDRSFVINLNQQSFINYFNEQKDFSKEASREQFFITNTEQYRSMIVYNDINDMQEILLRFLDEVNQLLNKVDRQKGVSFRTLKNIGNYISNAKNLTNLGINESEMIDLAFKQTIVKKIVGDIQKFDLLLGNREKQGRLFDLLDQYSVLSDFKETREELEYKMENMLIYGYTTRT